jgi:hypothetical protein
MVYENKCKNKIILDNFALALKICIGNLELLMENNINHNDVHDGNFGFTKEGRFRFIDFGMTTLLSHINDSKYKEIVDDYNKDFYDDKNDKNLIIKKHLLFRELRYLKNMYYFDDDSTRLDFLYEDIKYSPIKHTLNLLKEDEYNFGSHKKYLSQKIDINKLKKMLDSI